MIIDIYVYEITDAIKLWTFHLWRFGHLSINLARFRHVSAGGASPSLIFANARTVCRKNDKLTFIAVYDMCK